MHWALRRALGEQLHMQLMQLTSLCNSPHCRRRWQGVRAAGSLQERGLREERVLCQECQHRGRTLWCCCV